jgi:hypothetical protein
MAGAVALATGAFAAGAAEPRTSSDALAKAFATPPKEAQPWCYWWWLNGAASKEGITRDFEEMRDKGIGGALLFDAGEAGPAAPRGPHFMSNEWRELYKHAVREADRCGIVLTVNLCSGWNAGGPWVTPEHAAKGLASSISVVKGPGKVTLALPQPQVVNGFYQDVAVLACPMADVWNSRSAVNITRFMAQDGKLEWLVPDGQWKILRIGTTLHGKRTKCVGSGPGGLEIDPMSAEAMDAHFAETGTKLLADAGPLVGKTLQYFHIDSWELGQPTWTPKMRVEFEKRRGYDPLMWLPAVLGQTVDTDEETARFMHDYRRTAADLVAENYYGRLEELSVKGGLRGTHPESGGPFFNHWIDALQCMGRTAIPMGEFWRRIYEPDGEINYGQNPSLKQAASAAHIYGKPLCQAEAFTSMATCDWTSEPWIFKDIGDKAFCEGITRNVLCFWVHQPKPDAKPGFQWPHVGTHFDSNITWWPMADGWLTYLARCQVMLRQGLFAADFAYLQNESIPSFLQKRPEQKPLRPAGFDYDVLNAEVLLARVTAKDGRLVLPDGMCYRYLVLPHEANAILSPATLNKVNELAAAGVTVIGPAARLAEIPKLRQETLDAITRADGQLPDIEFRTSSPGAKFDWIHRRDGERDIYFVSNQSLLEVEVPVAFRVKDKAPELWDAVTGRIRPLPVYEATEDDRIEIPMTFAPRQSFFVVFKSRKSGDRTQGSEVRGRKSEVRGQNFLEMKPVQELTGSWEVAFDPVWFYPDNGTGGKMTFGDLSDWTAHSDPAIKHFSGRATYRKTFDLTETPRSTPLFLDLGTVKNVARIRLNGRDLGEIWTAPWRLEITAAVKDKGNILEIEVANLWPNRLIGDATLPKDKRRTVTNVLAYDTMETPDYGCPKCEKRQKEAKPAELLPSGLLGPVRVLAD